MGYSGTHISAVETDRRSPTPRFLVRADKVFETGDKLERQGRAARTDALLEGFPEYVAQETRAAEIRLFEIGIVHGLLQTPEYARELADSAVRRGAITAAQAEERMSFLAERQAALLRPQPPVIFAIMDESCVRRDVGGAAVMGAQLAWLLEFAELPNTVLQIAPFTMGARPFNLPITVLTLPDRSVSCYAESQTGGHLDRESVSVLALLTAYHQLQAEALSQAATVAMISELRKGTT
jgi:hypothetical protein